MCSFGNQVKEGVIASWAYSLLLCLLYIVACLTYWRNADKSRGATINIAITSDHPAVDDSISNPTMDDSILSDPLHVYSGAVKKDHLTIKDYYVHVYFTTLVLICMQT